MTTGVEKLQLNDLTLRVLCPDCTASNRVPLARLRDSPECGRCLHSLFCATPVELDEARFDTFLQRSGQPLLVVFWASRCAACWQMVPAFKHAARLLEPTIRLGKVDTRTQVTLAARYQIGSTPALVLFVDGREYDRKAGSLNTMQIVDWTRNALPIVL